MKRKTYLIVYTSLILIIVILADMDRLPLHLLMKIPHYDWVAHFVLYGLFYKLLYEALNDRRLIIRRWSIELSFLIASVFIILEEFSQIFFPSRTFSLMDLLMGFLGIYLFRLFIKKLSGEPDIP